MTQDQPASSGDQHVGDVAFAVVVAVGCLSLLAEPALQSEPLRLALTLAMVAAYVILGLLGRRWLPLHRRPVAAAYFLVQLGLVAVIWGLAEQVGATWLVALPLTGQAAAYGRRWAAAVALGTLAVLLAPAVAAGADMVDVLLNGLALGAALVFVALFSLVGIDAERARAEVARLNEDLAARNATLAAYAAQAEELATVRERNRLAREIHDSLGHYLTVVNVQLEAAGALLAKDPDRARAAIENAQRLTREGLADVRRSVAALRADPAAERPLVERLKWLVSQARLAGQAVTLTVRGTPRQLTPAAELTLYRAAQEGLTNARRHAGEAKVQVLLEYAEQGQVRVEVADSGVGASAAELTDGFGLVGLRERAALLGGCVEVTTAPGAGFRLAVELPG